MRREKARQARRGAVRSRVRVRAPCTSDWSEITTTTPQNVTTNTGPNPTSAQNTINLQHHHPFSGVPAKLNHNTQISTPQRISIPTQHSNRYISGPSTAYSKPKENSTVNFNMYLHHQNLTNQATTQPASTDYKLKHELSTAIKSQKLLW